MRRAAGWALVAGVAAAAAVWRRRTGSRREHVDLYFDDGSMVSLDPGSDEAAPLLSLAHEVLAAARP